MPILRGELAMKNTIFLVKNFQKPTNAFLACFFNKVFLMVLESSENQISRPKKRSTKIFDIFFENSARLEKS